MERDAVGEIVFDDVGADHFAPDVVGAVGDGGSEDWAGDGAEDIVVGRDDASLVVIDGFPFGQVGGVAALEIGGAADLLGGWSVLVKASLEACQDDLLEVMPRFSRSSRALRARRSLFLAAKRRAVSVFEQASSARFP